MHTYSIVSVRDIKEEERFSMWMNNNVPSRKQLDILFFILCFQMMLLKSFNNLSSRISIHIYLYAKITAIHYPASFLFMFPFKQLK